MAKWCDKIGYSVGNVEVRPGVWEDKIIDRTYYGDVMSNFRKLQNSGEVNDSVNIANKISIVADPYASQNMYSMRYAEFMGTKWKVSNVEVQYPRLIITLGGVWNGNVEQTGIAE
jgi:hypothetical protein